MDEMLSIKVLLSQTARIYFLSMAEMKLSIWTPMIYVQPRETTESWDG